MSQNEIEAWYDEHAQALFGFLLNITRDESETRDVLQDLFARLIEKPRLLEGVRNPRGFLLRLAHNILIDRVRNRNSRKRVVATISEQVAPLFEPGSNPDEAAFRTALAHALTELPEDQRAVVHLKLWEECTFDAIAEILGIPLNTAASRYRYGLDKLRDRLRPLYEEIK